MSTRVQVRISTASVREGKDSKFWSLNVADEMTSGFERLPESDMKSFAISVEIWEQLKKASESKGAKWVSKKDKNDNAYLSTAPKVVVLEIEVARSLKDSVRVLGSGRNAMEVLAISGTVKKISVREQRQGNLLDLED
jgi:hypothetical protein